MRKTIKPVLFICILVILASMLCLVACDETDIQIAFDNNGALTIGGSDSGLNIADTTKIAFVQNDGQLNGMLSISVYNPQSAFDKIQYSVVKALAQTPEQSDYIVKDVKIDGGKVLETITAPAYGIYTVKVDYYKNDAIQFTQSKDITFRDTVNEMQVAFDSNGKLTLGGRETGLTVNDTTKVSFTQINESLKGILQVSVLNPENAFDNIVYSIYREGAVIDEVEYVDYVIENANLSGDGLLEFVTAPYYGKYKIKIDYIKNENVMFSVVNEMAFTASHYNFVYSNSTMPVLYAATDMVSSIDHTYPTYVAIHRSGTFDWNNLPDNTYPVPTQSIVNKTTKLALFNGDGSEKTTQYGALVDGDWGILYNGSVVTNALKQIKYWIGELYELDETSTFSIYSDDVVIPVTLWWTYGNNIDPANVNYVMYTEGAASTNNFCWNNRVSTKSRYEVMRQRYEEFLQRLQNGEEITNIWAPEHAVPMAMDNNVKYVVNTKASMLANLDPNDADYTEYSAMISSKLTQYTISEALTTVQDSNKTSELEFLLRTKWIDSNNEVGSANGYFATNNGKKNLLIIGTSVNGEIDSNGCGTDTTLMDFLPYIVEKYGNEYNIFYKGHPSYPINNFSDGRKDYFEQNNIIVLPNAVPAETYMYLYDQVYVGGYYSSTMASSQIGQTLFFIGQEDRIKAQPATSAMFDTTSDDYLGVFENTEFITIDSINA